MVEQPTFSSRETAGLDLTSKPSVVIHRARQQVQRDFVDRASRLRRQTCQLRFELGRNLQLHEVQTRTNRNMLKTGLIP